MPFRSVDEFLALGGPDAPTTAERKLVEATKAGTRCELGTTAPTDPRDAVSVRASLLRLLILGGTKLCGLHETGVTLIGGWITGKLDLAFCSTQGRTALRHCTFEDRLTFGQTRFNYLSLESSSFPGLYAQGMRVKGNCSFRRVISNGPVNLSGARIGGQLVFADAQFISDSGKALNGQRLDVGGSILFVRANTKGSVHFNGARVGGLLDCTSARLDGNGGYAVYAQGIEIEESFLLNRATASGDVVLRGGTIGGQLSCLRASFSGRKGLALLAQRLTVKQGLVFLKLQRFDGRADLTGAHVGALVDDQSSWPLGEDQLVLNGFTYDRLGRDASATEKDRRKWLDAGSRWKGEFRPQPYTQFARVLREMGLAGEARKVLMERTGLQAKATRRSRRVVPNGDVSVAFHSLWADCLNLGHWIVDRIAFRVAGYGHAPVRSLWCLLGLFVTATFLAHAAWEEGAFTPNSDVVLASPGWAKVTAWDCFPIHAGVCDPNPAATWSNTFTVSASTPTQGADWDSFNRYGYAADLVVPFLDLGQTDAWAPSKDRGDWGWRLWWMRWILSAAGWVVTGLGVAAVTGVMQRNQPD